LDPNLHSHQSIQLVDQTIRRFVLLGTSTGLVVDLPKSNTWASFLMRLTNIFFLKNITRFVMFSADCEQYEKYCRRHCAVSWCRSV